MMKKLLESMSKIANTVTEDEFYEPKDDGGRSVKGAQKWSEQQMDYLQSGIRDSDDLLQDYYLSHLNYYNEDNRYSAMMKPYDASARPRYVELNFEVDTGGGGPYPTDIQSGRLYGRETYLGGFDEHENFISESMVAEDDLGVEPKRPSREGARPARGHKEKPRYTTVTEDEIDNEIKAKRDGAYAHSQGKSSNTNPFQEGTRLYSSWNEGFKFSNKNIGGKKLGEMNEVTESNDDNFDYYDDNYGDQMQAHGNEIKQARNDVAEKAFDLQLLRARNGQRAGNALDAERKLDNREVDEATHPSLKRSPEERKANRELWDRINSKGVVPSIDRERYTDIKGLEGPFRFKSGRVVYYDPQEGKYYDRDRDMYLDNSESLSESDEETKMELPPHLQALIKKHGLDKVMMKTPKRIGHSVKDVTPAGYGPDDKLGEGWESGPDEYERPERDPDHDYDTRRQEKADDEYERNNTFTSKYTVYDGVQHKAVAGPFASQAEAVDARSKIRLNSQHLSIQTAKVRVKPVTESEGGPVEAYGVKGLNSTKWQKTFRNSDALNKWVEANDAEMYGMREADPQYTKEKRQAAREDVSQSSIPSPTNAQPVTKELSELAVNPNKARPGQTADVKFNGWNIRYQLKPKQGSAEFKAMAVHSQSAKTPPISATGTSVDDVLAQIKAKIGANKGSAEISATSVMVDFNVLVTRDIVGHNDIIYGDVVDLNGTPTLLISATNEGGMQRAMDRRANANKTEGTTGQHAFSLPGKRARAAGLSHARYTLGQPMNYMGGVTAYPLEFNSEVHPGEVVRLSSPGVTIAYPAKSAGVVTESTIVEYANMEAVPTLRDRVDFKERMKTLHDIQIDPDTAKDPLLSKDVMRKRAMLTKKAREQGLLENWVVVNDKNKPVKMFESKTNAYNFVLENMFNHSYKVKHRDELTESNSTEKFGRALDKAAGDQSGDRTSGMISREERHARFLRQQAEKDAKAGKKVVKEYGATSTGSPTSKPGASAVPTPTAPTPVTPPTSVKPVAPLAPLAAGANPNTPTTPGASTDAANLASAAARDPKIAAQVKAMAAQAARPV